MTAAGTVAQLWRFPVKSFLGEQVESLDFDTSGAVGDRMWGVVDPAARKVLSAKRYPRLLEGSARLEAGGRVVLTLSDGTEHEAGDPATDAALAAWLDKDVALIRPPAGDGLPYELHTEADDDDSDLWEFPGPPGGPFVDLAAAHLLTTASLRAATALHPAGTWDVRRFRPGVLIDTAGADFVEDAWVGRPVTVGERAGVTFEPFMPTVRCSMPVRAQPGFDRDAEIARALKHGHDNNLGVYCGVATAGTVRVGDVVEVGPLP